MHLSSFGILIILSSLAVSFLTSLLKYVERQVCYVNIYLGFSVVKWSVTMKYM